MYAGNLIDSTHNVDRKEDSLSHSRNELKKIGLDKEAKKTFVKPEIPKEEEPTIASQSKKNPQDQRLSVQNNLIQTTTSSLVQSTIENKESVFQQAPIKELAYIQNFNSFELYVPINPTEIKINGVVCT